jgi:hypothetical protein
VMAPRFSRISDLIRRERRLGKGIVPLLDAILGLM